MPKNSDPPPQYLTIDGHRHCYRRTGQGPGLVLIHGLGETSQVFWRELTARLESQYTVVAVDLLGYGHSDKPKKGYKVAAQARVIARLIEELELENPVLLGHSLGGIVATRLALLFPDKLSKLIIYDSQISGGFWRDLGIVAQMPLRGMLLISTLFIPLVGKLIFKNRTFWMIRLVIDNLRLACDPADYTEEMAQEGLNNSYEAITHWIWNAIIFENLYKDLSQIRVPTLIIRGEHDPLVPQKWMERVNLAIPNSQLVIIKGACHTTLNEKPEQFFQAVAQFLATAA